MIWLLLYLNCNKYEAEAFIIIEESEFDTLRIELLGIITKQGDTEYDNLRTGWNGFFDN
jgi:hypothetical protein